MVSYFHPKMEKKNTISKGEVYKEGRDIAEIQTGGMR